MTRWAGVWYPSTAAVEEASAIAEALDVSVYVVKYRERCRKLHLTPSNSHFLSWFAGDESRARLELKALASQQSTPHWYDCD